MKINTGNGFEEFPVLNRLILDERLDEQLDGGNTQTRAKTPSKIPTFAETIVSLTDDETTQEMSFFAFPMAEKRAEEYYIHSLELVEPTRWLMGLTIDGLAVTQPIEGSSAPRKTLYDVLARVVRCFNTRTEGGAVRFEIAKETQTLLSSIESPEFSWEGGTLFFELLADIASVVDCQPRLLAKSQGDEWLFVVIRFDEVNDEQGEWEL